MRTALVYQALDGYAIVHFSFTRNASSVLLVATFSCFKCLEMVATYYLIWHTVSPFHFLNITRAPFQFLSIIKLCKNTVHHLCCNK